MLKDKIKTLRIKAELTQSELAKEVELPQSCISLWEKGNREPNLTGLKKLAEFFGVTTDYLLGISNEADNTTQLKIIAPANTLTEDEREALAYYRQLTPEYKDAILSNLEIFSRKSKEAAGKNKA